MKNVTDKTFHFHEITPIHNAVFVHDNFDARCDATKYIGSLLWKEEGDDKEWVFRSSVKKYEYNAFSAKTLIKAQTTLRDFIKRCL